MFTLLVHKAQVYTIGKFFGTKMTLYEPNGRDIEEINIGENNKPHLFDITGGEREGGLSFHLKIGDNYFEVEIDHVLSNAVLLRCKYLLISLYKSLHFLKKKLNLPVCKFACL